MILRLSIDNQPDKINTLRVLGGALHAGLRFPHFGLRIRFTTRWPFIAAWFKASIIEGFVVIHKPLFPCGADAISRRLALASDHIAA
jgi:hypothetical protein